MSQQTIGTALTRGPVLIIGTGLLGTSLGLALRRLGVNVYLQDTSPSAQALARDMGAGEEVQNGEIDPEIVLVCAPPDVTADCVNAALRQYPQAWVSDVASVKNTILQELKTQNADLSRYVGSHPMAGRERSGATAADADLFAGRPWAIVPNPQTQSKAITTLRALATDVGAIPVEFEPAEHDLAVALVSHVPQLISSLLAAQLKDADASALALAGQGLRDVTRIAASDPSLWTAIIAGNRASVSHILRNFAKDLSKLTDALGGADEAPLAPGVVGAVNQVMVAGNQGQSNIPGKHGGAARRYKIVSVLVPDRPGELARLFNEVGQAGINIEDLDLEHSAGQPVGQARLSVIPASAEKLEQALSALGWRVVLD